MNVTPERLPFAVGERPVLLTRQQRRAAERQTAKDTRKLHHGFLQPRPVQTELERAGHHVQHNGISHVDLSIPAYNRLDQLLHDRGNKLSQDHRLALYALVGTMTEMAQHRLTGRWAFGLPTGTGKTTAIAVWCATLKADHISVAVSASKIEALCELKREMIKQGVEPKKIGLIHSKKYDPEKVDAVRAGGREADRYASEPSEGEDRQIMLVTHQRVRGCSLDSFNLYKGKPRDLLLYDESLVVSDSLGIPVNMLKGALGWLKGTHGTKEKYSAVISYLDRAVDEITNAHSDGGEIITLPERTEEQISGYREVLGKSMVLDPVRSLLDLYDQQIRVIPTGQGGVVWYNVSVPSSIKNILVLDASQPIRKLVHLDPTIKDAEKGLPQIKLVGTPLSNIKKFDNVTIRQMFAGGGRSTMTDHFARDNAEDRKVSQAVIEVVKAVPDDEAVLIFTYKHRPTDKVDFPKIILGDLEDAGVKIGATVDITLPNGTTETRPRINVVTWGMETSTNDYDHCSHVILAGVLQRSPVDLAAAFLGQTDNFTQDIGYQVVKELQSSEVCHMIYQALSRGRCRKVSNGQALPMTGWIIHKDDQIKKEMEKVLPGASWKVWQSEHFAQSTKVIATLAAKIEETLDGLSKDVAKVSTMKLRGMLEAKAVPQRTWHHALQRYLDSEPEWCLEGRSLVRWTTLFDHKL